LNADGFFLGYHGLVGLDLFDAFGLAPGSMVAAVGGGGKTSLVYALAGEAAGRGLSAVVTTTTRFTRPRGLATPPMVEGDAASIAAALRASLAPGRTLVAVSSIGPRERLLGFAPEVVDSFADLGIGLLTVEADGSAQRHFKAPAEHEPSIPSRATDVVVCVGLDILGKPLDDRFVHRPEVVAELAGAAAGEPVTAEMIVRVLLHEAGGRKGLPPNARLLALLNGPPTEEHVTLGTHIASRLVYGGYHRAVVATAHRPGDIRAVLR
jgi:molybdenum cofactor cytidylyltransferase